MNSRKKKDINKRKNQKKILVVGGYGNHNVGDEAQLNAVLERLKRCFPDFRIVVLTPDPQYTYRTHGRCMVGEAPRIAFFHQESSRMYNFITDQSGMDVIHRAANIFFKVRFLLKSNWICFNAHLVNLNLPTILLGSQAATLLYDIFSSKMLYFEGGGYLTGATLSRLWDGILMCRLAHIFNLKIVMSGQTMGVWNNNFNKMYARKGFKYVDVISLRDSINSPRALAEIQIKGDNVKTICDDALFCEYQSNDHIIDSFYKANDISNEFREKGFVAVNTHYWKIDDLVNRNRIVKTINEIIEYILQNTELNVVMIPMHPTDIDSMHDYLRQYSCDRVRLFDYDYDFRNIRRVIKDSFACITMKHHPIIFAAGEGVPVISLNYHEYYRHKNNGALDILGIAGWSVDLEDENSIGEFRNMFKDIMDNKAEIIDKLFTRQKEIKKELNCFEEVIRSMLEE